MKTTDEMLSDICDVFTGADGGIAFVKLKFFLHDLENNPALQGSERALKMLEDFHKLISMFYENENVV